MPFETIERVGAAKPDTVPDMGLRVSNRAIMKGGRYIAIQIGGGLAKALVMRNEQVAMALQFGTGRDAGKIALSVDATAGQFLARRNRRGIWRLTINAASADGMFALDFPPFAIDRAEVVFAQGKCPVAVFAASAAMLAVDD